MTLDEINKEILHLNTDKKLIDKRLAELTILKNIEDAKNLGQIEMEV